MVKKSCISCGQSAYASKRSIPALCDKCIDLNIRVMASKK